MGRETEQAGQGKGLDVGGSEAAVGEGCNAQRFLKEPAVGLKHQVLD